MLCLTEKILFLFFSKFIINSIILLFDRDMSIEDSNDIVRHHATDLTLHS